jgi:hypothetical protein
VLGLTQSLASLANICAAPLSGWLLDHSDLTAWGTVAAALCGAALLMRPFGSSRLAHVSDD